MTHGKVTSFDVGCEFVYERDPEKIFATIVRLDSIVHPQNRQYDPFDDTLVLSSM